MPRYNVDIATHGTVTFHDIEADSEGEAVTKGWAAMNEGREPDEHSWEYGHMVQGCGDDADATELPGGSGDGE